MNNDTFFEHLFQTLFIAMLIIIFGLVLMSGIDKSIENQDTMLCQSAKVSGNEEYLYKCQCFYKGGDIKCLQEK